VIGLFSHGGCYERLERGTFRLPPHPEDTYKLEVNNAELSLILDGIDLAGARRQKRYIHATSHSNF